MLEKEIDFFIFTFSKENFIKKNNFSGLIDNSLQLLQWSEAKQRTTLRQLDPVSPSEKLPDVKWIPPT